jgi:hypothetical protein
MAIKIIFTNVLSPLVSGMQLMFFVHLVNTHYIPHQLCLAVYNCVIAGIYIYIYIWEPIRTGWKTWRNTNSVRNSETGE